MLWKTGRIMIVPDGTQTTTNSYDLALSPYTTQAVDSYLTLS